MRLEEFEEICSALKGVATDMKWGENLCYMVKDKIFLLISLEVVPLTAAFKVDPEDFYELTGREGIIQAPHFAKTQWVSVTNISLLGKKEWEGWIKKSYDLVVQKLPAKVKKDL